MSVYARKQMEGKERNYLVASSTTVTANTFGAFSSGYLIPATSATTELRVLILNTVTAGGGEHPVCECLDLDSTVVLEADTAANTSQDLVGTKVDLTDATTVNGAGTTNKVFLIRGLVGATTNKKVSGNIVEKDA